MNLIVIFAVATLLGLNAIATVVVARSTLYERRQKWLQCAFIWLVPFIGGILAWLLARESNMERRTIDFTSAEGADDGDLRIREIPRLDVSPATDNGSSGESADS